MIILDIETTGFSNTDDNGISPVMVKDEKPFEFYKEKINEIIKGADLVLGYPSYLQDGRKTFFSP